MPATKENHPQLSDCISTLMGRAYYLQLGLHERLLKESGQSAIRPGMCNVICALFEEDGATMSQVANRILVAKSTMTGTVDRLKEKGYVKVKADKEDRRAQRLHLTAKGKKIAPTLVKVLQELDSRICGELNAKGVSDLRKLVKATISSVE